MTKSATVLVALLFLSTFLLITGCESNPSHTAGADSNGDADSDGDSDSDSDADDDTDDHADTSIDTGCKDDDKKCDSNFLQICKDDKWEQQTDCTIQGLICTVIDGTAQCYTGTTDTGAQTQDTGSDTTPLFIDQDHDGVNSILDCNDADPTVYPGAPEAAAPSGKDENCDGQDGYEIDTDTDKSDPTNCDDAEEFRTYMGCDFWPTITYNMVWYNPAASTGFDFAVVVANSQSFSVDIEITGGSLSAKITETIPAGEMKSIVLPWVQDLKGTTFNTANTSGNRVTTSVRKNGGAYHMISTAPVTTWQFSPLEFEVIPVPSGCIDTITLAGHCYSVTNDASLLLPSTAMTGAYRAFTYGGVNTDTWGDAPGAIAITATQDNTLVKVNLTGDIVSGTDITAATSGSTIEYTMNAGDVVELLGKPGASWNSPHADLTGSIIIASDAMDTDTSTIEYKPIQVIGLSPIADLAAAPTADHVEEAILPAEVLGHKYIVVPPTGGGGSAVEHRVRIVGNVDGTTLTYEGATPTGAPTTLSAGQWVDVITTTSFIVSSQDASHPFMVVSFVQGDEPSVTMEVSPEQFRNNYTFLAPTSYSSNYIDVLIPTGATVKLDGTAIAGYNTLIGTTGWSVQRVALTAGPNSDGKHSLTSDLPVGLQIMGYGAHTSYYYPGGMKLDVISDPPIIVIE